MWLRYWLYLPIHIIAVLLRYPLAPFAVLFATPDNRLPNWLFWLDTEDNTLYGDEGWQSEHCPDYTSYCCKVKWLWRNGMHNFDYFVIGTKVSDNPPLIVTSTNARFGWGGAVTNGMLKYNFSPRLSGILK